MNFERTVAASIHPISRADAKTHLRVDHTDEDDYIDTVIAAAVDYAENYTDRQFITATWVARMDEFPTTGDNIELRKNPIASITSIQYVDTNGTTQTWSSANYETDLKSNVARIRPISTESYPSTKDQLNAVTVTFISGYGSAASDVPGDIKHALKLIIAYLYDNRDTVTFDDGSLDFHSWPPVVKLLLDQIKIKSFV